MSIRPSVAPASARRPPSVAPTPAHRPLLAQLKVGTKLMLLVLLPVAVLIAFILVTAIGDWHTASQLDSFRSATRLTVATATAAGRLADERTAAVIARLRPSAANNAAVARAQVHATRAVRQAEQQAADWTGAADVTGRLSAADQQLSALRLQTAVGVIPVPSISQSYGIIINNLDAAAGELLGSAPTPNSERAAQAYQAILLAVEAAGRERVAVATTLGTAAHIQLAAVSQWPTLESTQLDDFRHSTTGLLAADLEGVLFTPAGLEVQTVRTAFVTNPRRAIRTTSLGTWLAASGTRIDGLRRLERGTAAELAATASRELSSARTSGARDLSLLLGVLAAVTALALALRRSITRPLREVAAGARTLSGGDLDADVSYAGRDEIGDVAAAFRDLRVTAGRVAAEIRSTNAAISANRLDHRADVDAFQGTWAQLLAGMNDTTAEFARLHLRRRRAEREVADIFHLSLDLLSIAGIDGYFKRVNPAFEQTLGYTSEELLSRPFASFVHPADRVRTQAALDSLASGQDLVEFENRYIRRDGIERWLQWSVRSMPDEGLVYAAARDVTDSRRASEEQVALRRVATLVARGVPSAQVFEAVVAELYQLLDPASAGLLRYAPDGAVTTIATRGEAGPDGSANGHGMPGTRRLAAAVWRSGRAVRADSQTALRTRPAGSAGSRCAVPPARRSSSRGGPGE